MAYKKLTRLDHEDLAMRYAREAEKHITFATNTCGEAGFEHIISANRAAQRARSRMSVIGISMGKRHSRIMSLVSKADRAVGVATRKFKKRCMR